MTDRVYPEVGANRNGFPRGPKGSYTNLKVEQPPPFQAQPPPFQARPPPPKSARAEPYYDKYDGRPRRRNCCCRCLLWSCLVFILVVFILGIAALAFYLVVHPRAPKYNVQDVRLSSFAITPSGSVSSGLFQLSATTTYSVEARNSNKHIGIYYDRININVESEGAIIGKGNVAPFYQGHQNTTIISGQVKSQNVPLVSTVGTALQAAEKNGKVPLVVAVDVRVRVKVGKLKTPHFWVHVRCNVDVNPNATGSQVLSKTCKVKN